MTSRLSCPPGGARRIFPPVDHGAETGAERSACPTAGRLMRLPARTLTRREVLLGWGLDADGRMGRLLVQLRAAVAAESAGLASRADVFWWQLHHGLRRLCSDPGFWQALAAPSEGEPAIDAALLRRSFVREVVIDTHCAFYNGRLNVAAESGPRDRAFVHIDYIVAALDLAELTDEQKLVLLAPAGQERIAAWVRIGRRDAALRACRRLAGLGATHAALQDHVVALLLQIAGLGEQEGHARPAPDASAMQSVIDELEALRSRCPDLPAVYSALGTVRRAHAELLARRGDLSAGLVEIERALAYDPESATAASTREELRAAMSQLQERMADVRARLAAMPNAELNTEGRKLAREAHLGTRAADTLAGSPEVQRIKAAHARARDQARLRSAAPAAPDASVAASEPVLPSPAHSRPGHEPLGEWLCSWMGWRVKLQAALALLLVVVGGAIGVHDVLHHLQRERAYREARAAFDGSGFRQAAEQMQVFLNAPPFATRDPREEEIRALQAEALVRWFAAHPEDFAGASSLRLNRYSAVQASRESAQ